MPRLRDLADQHLYKMDRQVDHGCLNPLFHSVADTHLLREQWDSLVRVAASLKNRTAPANVIVQRLGNASSSDRLGAASASVVTGSEVLLVPNGPRYGIEIRVYHSDEYECRPERKPSAA